MKRSIENINIFDFLGLSVFSPERKGELLDEMHRMFFGEFLFLKLATMLKKEELLEIEMMIEEKKEIGQIVAFVAMVVPNFYTMYQRYVNKQKIIFIKKYIKNMILDLDKAFSLAKTEAEKGVLIGKRLHFEKMQKYIENNKDISILL